MKYLSDTIAFRLKKQDFSIGSSITWFLAMVVIVVGISNAQTGMFYEQFASTDLDGMLTATDTPDYTETVTSSQWDGTDRDNYIGRLTGYIIPPVTGNYTFWLNTDDNGRLWLSTDSDPANATIIATETGYSGMNSWAAVGDEEVSAPIALVGGNVYWIRAANREVGGGDHVQIGWASPEAGINGAAVIGGADVWVAPPVQAHHPAPADGQWLRFPPAELSWKLPLPRTSGTVTCDVIWYSGDPNEQTTTTELLVTGGAVESVALEGRADALADYWWQVNCYDPNLPGPAIKTEGPLWMFTTNRDTPMVFVDETDDGTVVAEQDETSDTYTVSLSSSPAQPVTITTYSVAGALAPVPVVAGTDDAEENMAASGTMDVGSSDLELGMDGSEDQIVGVRFRDIQLPPGSVISSARVAFVSDRGSGPEDEDVYLTIYGRLTDPGAFTSTAYNLSTQGIDDETTAEVEWTMLNADASSHWADGDPATEASTSPNLAAIVQEIIDQPSWAAGNALVLLFENGNSQGKTAASSQRRAESYNGNAALAPVLHIEYATAGPGDQITMSQTVVVLDSTNWEAGVEVTVTAVDDDVIETDPHTATLLNVVTSPDAAWNVVTANSVVVSINDNECGTWSYNKYDLNTDCYVDLGDLKMLALEWLTCSTPNTGECVDYR